MARWITVTSPFDFTFPSRAIMAFKESDLGEHMVKDEVANYAVANGKAREGKADGSEARSVKGKVAKRAKPAKVAVDAAPADTGSEPELVRTDRPDDDSASVRGAVDSASG